jgi:hypothetical protein
MNLKINICLLYLLIRKVKSVDEAICGIDNVNIFVQNCENSPVLFLLQSICTKYLALLSDRLAVESTFLIFIK